jgi:phosphinothricin acetyltransferase
MEDDVKIRDATEDDLVGLNDLYNHYVRESHSTFDIAPLTMKWRAEWFTHYSTSGRYRLLVAAEEDRVLGFTTSSRVRPKQAYETSVETSIYLVPDTLGRGIGTKLYSALFERLVGEDIHRAYAGITMPNPVSVRLHERFGFKQVAYFTEQGRKFGRYWDVAWFEKEI